MHIGLWISADVLKSVSNAVIWDNMSIGKSTKGG